MTKKTHRYPPYQHSFDDLCDAGCGRVVPLPNHDGDLRRLGWEVEPDSTFIDGKRRTCAACVDLREQGEQGE
jgi:hypothetical protein